MNGDADEVIGLEAKAEHCGVAVSGAVNEAEERDAIVRMVDGGERDLQRRLVRCGS